MFNFDGMLIMDGVGFLGGIWCFVEDGCLDGVYFEESPSIYSYGT